MYGRWVRGSVLRWAGYALYLPFFDVLIADRRRLCLRSESAVQLYGDDTGGVRLPGGRYRGGCDARGRVVERRAVG